MSSRSSSSASSTNSKSNEESKQQQYQHRESRYKGLTTEEFWKLKKKERKERVRERNKEKKEEKNKEWDTLPAEEQERIRQAAADKHEQKRKEQAEFNEECMKNLESEETPALVFDLHFATSMNLRDVKSTTNQIKLSCSAMRKEKYLLKPIFVSGVDDDEKQRDKEEEEHVLEENQKQKDQKKADFSSSNPGAEIFPHLQNFEGFKKFPHPFLKGQVTTVLDPKKTVYLTADSPNVLWDMKPGENYVIGAFVDHNTMKNGTFNYATKDLKADEVGLRTARLPLDESISVGNRCKVLTINHVVDVMLNYAKTKSWKQALLGNLPTRRVVTSNNEKQTNGEEQQLPQRRDREEEDEENKVEGSKEE